LQEEFQDLKASFEKLSKEAEAVKGPMVICACEPQCPRKEWKRCKNKKNAPFAEELDSGKYGEDWEVDNIEETLNVSSFFTIVPTK
jgi:hypothetical protein